MSVRPRTPGAGFTLIEVLISTMVLTVAALTVLMLLPGALRAQQDNRARLVAALHAQSLMDAFIQHEFDFRGQHSRMLTGEAPAKLVNSYQPTGDPWIIQNAPDPERDQDLVSLINRFNRMLGSAGRFDLETVTLSSLGGLYPVPPSIARRLDSANDEIREILDQGGQVFYIDPLVARRFDAGARKQGLMQVQDAPTQRLVVGIVGSPQQNLLPANPAHNPITELYPFPPMHRAYPVDRVYAWLAGGAGTSWQILDTYTLAAGETYRGVELTSDITVVEIEPGVLGTRLDIHPMHSQRNLDQPRDTYWEGHTWEALARLENLEPDPASQASEDVYGTLRPANERLANAWRSGLPFYRRLANQHWLRILHQLGPIPGEPPGHDRPTTGLAGLPGTTGVRTGYRVTYNSAGNVIVDASGRPVLEEYPIPGSAVNRETLDLDGDGSFDAFIEWAHPGAEANAEASGFLAWPAPFNGHPLSTLQGTDIPFEDEISWLADPTASSTSAASRGREAYLRRGLPSLERRIQYRSAALALWASVACFREDGGVLRPVDIRAPDDPTRILVDLDGDHDFDDDDLDADGDGTADFDANGDGTLDGSDLTWRPADTTTEASGNVVYGRGFLPARANPLLTPFDELCLVKLSDSGTVSDFVLVTEALAAMEAKTPAEIQEGYTDTSDGWREFVQPAQVLALSHVAHAAMMVTGYKRPFVDENNTPDPSDDIDLVPEALADLPHKAVEPWYAFDPRLEATRTATGSLLAAAAGRLAERRDRGDLLILELDDGNDPSQTGVLFDQVAGAILAAPLIDLSAAPPAWNTGVSLASLAAFTDAGGGLQGTTAATAAHERDFDGDGSGDDLDGDGTGDAWIYIADPRANLALLPNPYHWATSRTLSELDILGIPALTAAGEPDLAGPNNDPDDLTGDADGDNVDPADSANTDLGLLERYIYTGTWRGVFTEGDKRNSTDPDFDSRPGLASGAIAYSNPPDPGDFFTDVAATATAPDYDPATGGVLAWAASVFQHSAVPLWDTDADGSADLAYDLDGDGTDEAHGPIPYRAQLGPVLNPMPPPYADRGDYDFDGRPRYRVVYRLEPVWHRADGTVTDVVAERDHATYRLVHRYAGNDGAVTARTGYEDTPDLTAAARAHENALRLAVSYVSANPYDNSVPRPANRQAFTDRPLFAFDPFDQTDTTGSATARRPEDYPGATLVSQFLPITFAGIGTVRFGSPAAGLDFVQSIHDWNRSYSFLNSRAFSDDPAVQGSGGLAQTQRLAPDTFPPLARAYPAGRPFVFGSPYLHPDEAVAPGAGDLNGDGLDDYGLLRRDVDGNGDADLALDPFYGAGFHISTGAWAGADRNYLMPPDHNLPSSDPNVQAKPSGNRFRLSQVTSQEARQDYGVPALRVWRDAERYQRYVNRLHGHTGFGPERIWQVAPAVPGRFHHTKGFEANHRARQLVYWTCNWLAYEDAESAPGAPIDVSRLPQTAGQSVYRLPAATNLWNDVDRSWPTDYRHRYFKPDSALAATQHELAVVTGSTGSATYTWTFRAWSTATYNPGDSTGYRFYEEAADDFCVDEEGTRYARADAATFWDDAIQHQGYLSLELVEQSSRYLAKDLRFPFSHYEYQFAWMDPERTATRLAWDASRVTNFAAGTAATDQGAISIPGRHVALPLTFAYSTSDGRYYIPETSLDHIAIPHLAPFGADRNGNGRHTVGPVPRTVRMQAKEVARFNFYDPVMWISLRQ